MSHHHFILHKPYGYLSQFIYELKRKKKLLGELHDFPEGTMAIGRLDEDSEGLLLQTSIFGNKATLDEKYNYSYDEKGNLKEQISYDYIHKTESRTNYEYEFY